MGETVHKQFWEIPVEKRPLRRPRRRWNGNVKMDISEASYEDGCERTGSESCSVVLKFLVPLLQCLLRNEALRTNSRFMFIIWWI